MTEKSSGCLLLSLERNAIFSLNESARAIWGELEQANKGLSLEQLVLRSQRQFSEDLSRTQLTHDVESLSERLIAAGFISVAERDSERTLKITKGVYRSAEGEGLESGDINLQMDEITTPGRIRKLTDTIFALSGLFLFDIVKGILGIGRLLSLIKRLPMISANATPSTRTRQLCDSVNRAKLWYPKQIHCLQHSAVVTSLLRINGIPAAVMLGASQRPFYAHAWAEVCGTVVNDEQSVRDKYAPFVKAWS